METYSPAALCVQFLPKGQILSVKEALDGEEQDHFTALIFKLGQRIHDMPATYEQDGKGDDAIAYLHYFSSGCDWWITEKDVDGGIQEAFGLARLNGGHPSLGYISIAELSAIPTVEMDFYWTPKTLREVKNEN